MTTIACYNTYSTHYNTLQHLHDTSLTQQITPLCMLHHLLNTLQHLHVTTLFQNITTHYNSCMLHHSLNTLQQLHVTTPKIQNYS